MSNFKNAGRTWCQTAEPVLVHAWPQDATGQAVLKRRADEIGEYVSDEEMRRLCIQAHGGCPTWNDTLHPRRDSTTNRQIIQ